MAPLPWTAFKVGFASLAAGSLIGLGAFMLLLPPPGLGGLWLWNLAGAVSLAAGIGFAAWTVRLVSGQRKQEAVAREGN